jgi:hypothetical protein
MRTQKGWVALWHGGYSYAPGYMSEHAEYFPTLKAAKREFGLRYMGWAQIRRIYVSDDMTVTYVANVIESTRTPAVDETAVMDLYPLWDDMTIGEFSRRIEYGPRGGMTVTNV